MNRPQEEFQIIEEERMNNQNESDIKILVVVVDYYFFIGARIAKQALQCFNIKLIALCNLLRRTLETFI